MLDLGMLTASRKLIISKCPVIWYFYLLLKIGSEVFKKKIKTRYIFKKSGRFTF